MTIDCKCKFCKLDLHLSIDPDYAALGDPYKLLPLVCCNRCGDFRLKRRSLIEAIKEIAYRLQAKLVEAEDMDRIRARLGRICLAYIHLWAGHYRRELPTVEEGYTLEGPTVEAIIASPHNFPVALQGIRTMFASQQPQLI